MSSPLAIAAVSAVLRNLLDNGMVDVGTPVGAVDVSAVAPDLVDLDDPTFTPTLNLFLYRVTPNPGWRNASLPSRNGHGDRIANPPLALDLHYLLTAYADEDFQAEILLGYAMHLLHERPVLDRAAIRRALDPSPLDTILPPAFQALAASDLADQVEAVTVTPEPMDTEEVSRLWAALQSKYRPTVGYVVTTVLIESRAPARDPLPVLSRGPVDEDTGRDRGVVVTPGLLAPFPTITAVVAPDEQPAAVLGDVVRVTGHHLAGTDVRVSFSHRLLDEPIVVDVGDNADPTGFDLTLPSGGSAAQDWPAGLWTVTATLVPPDEPDPRTSNVAALLHAPVATLPPSEVDRGPTGAVTVTLGVAPVLRPEQDARLALGSATAVVAPHPAATDQATFVFADVPPGDQWLRLTVDGVDSLLVDRSDPPPVFDPTQSVDVPA
ncbi:DUF4255 domain-containing protein [Salsipaludibacter albus]|uniref:DUF4255 domain-containing protein n=1 Tax=Salsipaludibacter albus TaxID=2849650 RepID=UPI001EE41D11|nr:DUF4255 domain-containing protein [Salsipaludibacter albus]MBY5164289.1 DUF4255 domain-containing protein [Salsipaludibacter albus]